MSTLVTNDTSNQAKRRMKLKLPRVAGNHASKSGSNRFNSSREQASRQRDGKTHIDRSIMLRPIIFFVCTNVEKSIKFSNTSLLKWRSVIPDICAGDICIAAIIAVRTIDAYSTIWYTNESKPEKAGFPRSSGHLKPHQGALKSSPATSAITNWAQLFQILPF